MDRPVPDSQPDVVTRRYDPIKGPNARRWLTLSRAYLLHAEANHLPCWLCGKPIDYRADRRRHPNAATVDHRIPRSTRPDLAFKVTNLAPAHRHCNLSRGARTARPHRITTRTW